MSVQQPNLTLDERAFEGLLAAAFTIQEHNDRQKRALESDATTSVNACPHCGAQRSSNAAVCSVCGLSEFRPGERLQRNWASMWLHSQDQSSENLSEPTSDQTSEHLSEHLSEEPTNAGTQPNRISANVADDFTAKGIRPGFEPLHAVVADNAVLDKIKTTSDGGIADLDLIEAGHTSRLWPLSNFPATESSGFANTQSDVDSAIIHTANIHSANIHSANIDLTNSLDFDSGAAAILQSSAKADSAFQRLFQRASDWRVKLRFQRADFFLGLSVFVAATALLWPAAVPRRPGALDPWERALVVLGIAEAPEPTIHLQGDPGVNVWIDPHSALYYCPGEDQYGKTTDGRLSSQREAQMDRFEPASRTPCE